jgi:hypothetical protein
MATVYSLSSYSLATIALTVASASATPTYIWTAAVPSGAKGKAGILQLFFNLYNATNFFANQTFNYGIYVDGVALAIGDSSTVTYTQTAATPYAISSGGVLRGTNGVSGYSPIVLPVSFSAGASVIQLGITSSSLALSSVTSANPVAASQTTYYAGYTGSTPWTSNYTVPATASGSAVVGVYVYLWGGGGANSQWASGYHSSGAPGGFVSGYYACSPGTVLTCYSGGVPGGLGYGSPGGSFGGVFLSNAAGPLQTNAIAIAGGGGTGANVQYESAQGVAGGPGGYPDGGPSIRYNGSNSSGTNTGGTQTAAGPGGYALLAATNGFHSTGGGGWYGGGCASGGGGGGGGSSYIGNVNGATGGIGLTASAYWENGQAVTYVGGTGANANVSFPGGAGYTPAYATGSTPAASNVFWNGLAGKSGITNGTSGAQITVVPAIGSSATQVGVQANIFVV